MSCSNESIQVGSKSVILLSAHLFDKLVKLHVKLTYQSYLEVFLRQLLLCLVSKRLVMEKFLRLRQLKVIACDQYHHEGYQKLSFRYPY